MSENLMRWDLINHYIEKYNFTSFLEIGHDQGVAFDRIKIKVKESIDPAKETNPTYVMSSDDFFEVSANKYDIIFIDGLHEHSQVYRDIVNSLSRLTIGGVIIMHDCHPISDECQRHSFTYPGGAWTGDCWKAYVKARATLPYEMRVWDYDWGCGIIDTRVPKISDTTGLPTVMATMQYPEFVRHPEWMNYITNMP